MDLLVLLQDNSQNYNLSGDALTTLSANLTPVGVGDLDNDSQSGNDILSGTANVDLFLYSMDFDFGQDEIIDFMVGEDKVLLANVLDANGLMVEDNGTDIIITADETAGLGEGGTIMIDDIGDGTFNSLASLVGADIVEIV